MKMEHDHAGNTVSVWMGTEDLPRFHSLKHHEAANVCVVGAGIAGLTTAYLLGLEGKHVIVLDDGPIVSGETERTTAHLTHVLDDRFFDLEKLYGKEATCLVADSHTSAINCIEAIVTNEGVACDFERVPGYLFLPPGEPLDILERELVAAHRAGIVQTQWVERAPISFDTGPALCFPNQAQFHPLKYLTALAKAIVRDGGKIFTYTHATTLEGGPFAHVTTQEGYTITADALVIATNSPVNDWVAMHTKQASYRTYVIGMRVPSNSVTKALYWDTMDPYHYVRLHTIRDRDTGLEHDILIVGGEDHKTGQAMNMEERFQNLEAWTRERFPVQDIEYRWSGQVIEPVDSLAFIGYNPGSDQNMFIATGTSGNGMTYGTIAGILLRDLILNRKNPWYNIYDPSRKPLRAIGEFVKENINVATQYTDLVSGGDISDVAHIIPDSGAVIRRGTKKIAVYRDEAGQLHEHSAVCPHMGCVVSWNPVEKTWDCPCHGSRFNSYGEVINGPANHGLNQTDAHHTEHIHTTKTG